MVRPRILPALVAGAIALSGPAAATTAADAFVGHDPNADPRDLVALALAHEHGEGVPKDLLLSLIHI